MRREQRQQGEQREEEAVEDHRTDAHLHERDLAEEEAAAPQAARNSASGEAEGSVGSVGHSSTFARLRKGCDFSIEHRFKMWEKRLPKK